jgi:S-adenosylmethionine:tRNA ribosyltransferase-isomerase
MDVDAFDFELPPNLIAQRPAAERTDARLLHLPRADGPTAHGSVRDLPFRLRPGDLLVANDTRVFPARLLGHRVPSGGAVECLLIAPVPDAAATAADRRWHALMHPGQKLKPGARIRFAGCDGLTLHGEVLARLFHGRRLVRLWTEDGRAVDDVVDAIGHVPLPPYITREDLPADRERYQTVFAAHRGSVAAPTAGLHLSAPLLAALGARGIDLATVTLHVGYGTFQPVRVARVEDHRVDAERYEVSAAAAAAINDAVDRGRRIVAVGTTTTRVLEFLASAHDGRLVAGAGSTDLFIHPGHRFRLVGGLLTNFHLPRSSLLMLVAAFGGDERVMAAYREAVALGYRFYSYGDAMLIA